MIFLFFRFSGFAESAEPFVVRWALEPSHVWSEGEVSPRGELYSDSGFIVPLADAASWAQGFQNIDDFLDAKDDMLRELLDDGIDIELNIGVTVGEERSFAPSLEFPPVFLSLLGELGVRLNITAFPTDDGR